MNSGQSGGLDELRARRDALMAEIREIARRELDESERLLEAERARWHREDLGPDSANAHLRGFIRDLSRSLEEAQSERARALRDARDLAIRLERMIARRGAIEAFLARVAANLPEERR